MKTKLLLLLYAINVTVAAQMPLCQDTVYGSPAYIPINDLGSGMWNGHMGGLYPNGSNYVPPPHKNAGMQLAGQVQPLDAIGNPSASGKIGFISIGMSNATMEFSAFIPMGNADANKNPKVALVDCAEGGMSTDIISHVSAKSFHHYWDTTVVNRLKSAGLSARQVQIIWYKEAYPVGNLSTPPQTYSDSLKIQSKRIMNIIKNRFPNVRICYIASRIYAGYASSALNPEPYSYWQGWTMKWMIGEQINGDAMLQYSGNGTNAPWLCWGTYNWANGTTPRSDGLTWICPTDFANDGTHPSTAGRQKVATRLLNFLDADSTACWYRTGGCSSLTGTNENRNEPEEWIIYSDPSSGVLNIAWRFTKMQKIILYNSIGEAVLQVTDLHTNKLVVNTSSLPNGIYFVEATGGDFRGVKKFFKNE